MNSDLHMDVYRHAVYGISFNYPTVILCNSIFVGVIVVSYVVLIAKCKIPKGNQEVWNCNDAAEI